MGKVYKKTLSIFLALLMVITSVFMVQAEGVAFEVRENRNAGARLVADQDTRYITVFEQDPDTKLITATVQIQNGNPSESLVISTLCTSIGFTDKVSPYDMVAGESYEGGVVTDSYVNPYGTLLGALNSLSSQYMINNETARVIGAKIGASDSSHSLVVASGETKDVYRYYFMPKDGADLDISMFDYVSNYYVFPRRLSTWILNDSGLLAANRQGVASAENYEMLGTLVVSPEAFKIQMKKAAPDGLSADNDAREVIGYDVDTMEWADSISGTYQSGAPVIGDDAVTIYVRVKGDSDYTQTSPDGVYVDYKKYVASEAVPVEFSEGTGELETLEPPVFDDVYDDALSVTGTGEPGATVIVTFPNGGEASGEVREDRTWSVEVPEELVAGTQIFAIQTQDGKNSSEAAETTVLERTIQKSDTPGINRPIYTDALEISGTGENGAKITVTFIDDDVTIYDVDVVGENWYVTVPAEVTLTKGYQISAVQMEVGKDLISDAATATVLEKIVTDQSDDPIFNKPIYVGDPKISGKGKPGATITVTFINDDVTVDGIIVGEDGTWSVIVDGVTLTKDYQISAVQQEDGKEPSNTVTTTVEERPESDHQSEQPDINTVYVGDELITGTGVPGATIKVTFGDDEDAVIDGIDVDEYGNWTVEVPKTVELIEGYQISAVQTEPGKELSDPQYTYVVGEDVSRKPMINDVDKNDRAITGTGVIDAEVTVTFPAYSEDGEETIVTEKVIVVEDEDGNGVWSVDVPDGLILKPGTVITAVQQEVDKERPSEEATKIVKGDQDPEYSENPTINPIYEGDEKVTGRGKPGATITVTFPGGEKTAIVDEDGNWWVDVPDGVTLNEGDKVSAVQQEDDESKGPSDEITATVRAVMVTVSFNTMGGTPQPDSMQVKVGSYYGTLPVVDKAGYTFDGWYTAETDGVKIDEIETKVENKQDHTLYAQWSASTAEKYTVTYKAGNGSGADYVVPELGYGQTHTVLSNGTTAFTRSGYTFSQWTVNSNGTGAAYKPAGQITITGNVTLYAQWSANGNNDPEPGPGDGTTTVTVTPTSPTVTVEEDKTPLGLITLEHLVYLRGYPDKTVRPDNSITRAEAASIFFMLLNDANKNAPVDAKLSDVSNSQWYSQAVNYLASNGVIKGYPDGSFRPDQPITRAEFAVLASKFDKLSSTDTNIFSDVSEAYWAVSFINSAYAKGWVNGYPDETFKPEKQITRAEVVIIVNAMLGRKIRPENIPGDLNKYSDLSPNYWAYADILEASIPHNYVKDSNGYETWTVK